MIVTSKKYCRFWKACLSFKRSECENQVMEVENCLKYRELESQENMKELKGAIKNLRKSRI